MLAPWNVRLRSEDDWLGCRCFLFGGNIGLETQQIRSRNWVCPRCEVPNIELLPDSASSEKSSEEDSAPEVQISTSTESTEKGTAPTSLVIEGEPQIPESTPVRSNDDSRSTPPQQPLTNERQEIRSRSARPPLLLDGAIAVCLMLLVAILCKRLV